MQAYLFFNLAEKIYKNTIRVSCILKHLTGFLKKYWEFYNWNNNDS